MDNLILTDYIFLFIAFVSVLFGFARGFMREIFTILNLVLASFAAYYLLPTMTKFVTEHLKEESTIKIASSIASFAVSWVVIAVVNSFVLDALKFLRGGFVDRLLGSAFGLARGAMVVVGVYLGTVITVNAQNDSDKLPAWLKDAKSLNYIKVQAEYMLAVMPPQFQEFYKNQDESLKDTIVKEGAAELAKDQTEKLEQMGLGEEQLETLRKLLANTGDNLQVEDLQNLKPETVKMLGEQAIDDNEQAVSSSKKQKNELSPEQIEELRKQLDAIEVKEAW